MYTFQIDGVTYEVKSAPLNCGLDDHTHVEREELVTPFADPNNSDHWINRKG